MLIINIVSGARDLGLHSEPKCCRPIGEIGIEKLHTSLNYPMNFFIFLEKIIRIQIIPSLVHQKF